VRGFGPKLVCNPSPDALCASTSHPTSGLSEVGTIEWHKSDISDLCCAGRGERKSRCAAPGTLPPHLTISAGTLQWESTS